MLQLPDKLNQLYDTCLINKALSDKDSYFYKKWLRFYWDFCHKYHHHVFNQNSLPLFLSKLREKGQSEVQRKQASMAITFIFEISSELKENKSNTISNDTSLPSNYDQAKDNGSSTQK